MDEPGRANAFQVPVARGPARRRRTWLVLVVAGGIVVASVSIFVLTLPPALAIFDGSQRGSIRGDFPTIFSNDSLVFSFSATTYANQSQGPPSTLTLRLQGHTYWVANPYNRSRGDLQTWITANVSGHFARNVQASQVRLGCNGTGIETYVDSQPSDQRGVNLSFDRNAQAGFHDSGAGSLTATLVNQNGAGPYHDFSFSELFLMDQYKGYEAFVGFRATVTGWMLPEISVRILLQTVYVQRTLTLFPAGQTWTLPAGGYVGLEFNPFTAYTFTVAGAFEATSSVTAYILNLTEYLASGPGGTSDWRWTSGPAVTSGSINASFASEWGYVDPYAWYLLFVNSSPQQSTTVRVTEAIVVTI